MFSSSIRIYTIFYFQYTLQIHNILFNHIEFSNLVFIFINLTYRLSINYFEGDYYYFDFQSEYPLVIHALIS